MTKEEDAIEIIKSECYVFNPINFGRTTMINTALDTAVKSLKVVDELKTEIERQEKWLSRAGYSAYTVDIAFDTIKSVLERGSRNDTNNDF